MKNITIFKESFIAPVLKTLSQFASDGRATAYEFSHYIHSYELQYEANYVGVRRLSMSFYIDNDNFTLFLYPCAMDEQRLVMETTDKQPLTIILRHEPYLDDKRIFYADVEGISVERIRQRIERLVKQKIEQFNE